MSVTRDSRWFLLVNFHFLLLSFFKSGVSYTLATERAQKLLPALELESLNLHWKPTFAVPIQTLVHTNTHPRYSRITHIPLSSYIHTHTHTKICSYIIDESLPSCYTSVTDIITTTYSETPRCVQTVWAKTGFWDRQDSHMHTHTYTHTHTHTHTHTNTHTHTHTHTHTQTHTHTHTQTHTERYNYKGVLCCSWMDASSNCAVCTWTEFGPYARSQRGRVLVHVCWGKGVLLGVAPLLVYTETDRYLNVSILKSGGGGWGGC